MAEKLNSPREEIFKSIDSLVGSFALLGEKEMVPQILAVEVTACENGCLHRSLGT